jgi:hypothetical protein
MKWILSLAAALVLASCASFEGRGLVPGQSTVADVESVMGAPAEIRERPNGETWLYYPRQPYGRKMFVARIGPDERLLGIEQRLTDENVARIQPEKSSREEVRELLGPPYQIWQNPRQAREVWTWHMRRFGDPGIPVALHVQFSPDGSAREVYVLDESSDGWWPGLGFGFGFGMFR